MRGIQYAAAFPHLSDVSGILDHPPSRVMTAQFDFKKPIRHYERQRSNPDFHRSDSLDCFVAEPAIGRAFARPVGCSQ